MIRLKAIPSSEMGVMEKKPAKEKFVNSLLPPFPSIATKKTTISFTVAQTGKVSIKIYDEAGRLIKTLFSQRVEKGKYEIPWNLSDDSGRKVKKGVYFVRMEVGEFSKTREIVVLR